MSRSTGVSLWSLTFEFFYVIDVFIVFAMGVHPTQPWMRQMLDMLCTQIDWIIVNVSTREQNEDTKHLHPSSHAIAVVCAGRAQVPRPVCLVMHKQRH